MAGCKLGHHDSQSGTPFEISPACFASAREMAGRPFANSLIPQLRRTVVMGESKFPNFCFKGLETGFDLRYIRNLNLGACPQSEYWSHGVLACPGATGLEYGVAAEMFRRGVYGTPAPEARSGPGSDG